MPILNFLRDIVDANTASDQRKRLAKGGKANYAEDQLAKGNTRVNQNIATAAAPTVFRFLNTVKAGAGLVGGLAKIGAASVFGSDQSYKDTIAGVNKTYAKDTSTTGGIFHAGTVYNNQEEAQKGLHGTALAKRIVGTGAGLASEIMPAASEGRAATVGGRILRGAKEGAIIGGLGSAGGQLANEGKISVGDTAKAATFGGVVGGIASGLHGGKPGKLSRAASEERKNLVVSYNEAIAKNRPVIAQQIADKIDAFDAANTPKKGFLGLKKLNEAGGVGPDVPAAQAAREAAAPVDNIQPEIGSPAQQIAKQPSIISDINAPIQSSSVKSDAVSRAADALRGQRAGRGQSPVTGIGALQRQQQELYTAGRAAQLSRAAAARDGLSGEAALNATLGAYQGKLPRVNTAKLVEHVQSIIDEPTYVETLNHLQNGPNLKGFDASNAADAWRNFYREGKLPTPSEFKLLQKGAGSDFAEGIANTAIDSLDTSQRVKNFAVKVLSMPKSVMASFDLSGGGRQGSFLGSRYAKEWLNGQKAAAKAFASTQFAKDTIAEIGARENAPIYKQMGLDLVTAGVHEEQFPVSFAEQLPGKDIASKAYNATLGKGVAASDRGFTVGLNVQRADTADKILQTLQENGFKIGRKKVLGFQYGGEVTHDLGQLSAKELKDLGKYINTATGRGDLGALEKHATSLQEALFSPRLWKSRLDMLNPAYYAKLSGPAQKLALQNAGSFAAVAAAILGVAVAAGAQVETDARSSDFLKIKVGNTRFDILGGFQQNLVFAHRELTGEKKSSITGQVSSLTSGGYGQPTRLSILSDLIQNKENPVFAAATTQLRGVDKAGNPLTPTARLTNVGNLFIPLGLQDTYKTVKDSGPVLGVAKSLPGYFGVGSQTYSLNDVALSQNQKKVIENVKATGSPEHVKAYEGYFRTAKTITGARSTASEKINKALEAQDYSKAQQIARDYNDKVNKNFVEWRQKYSQYVTPELAKDYQKLLINLSSSNIAQRRHTLLTNSKKGMIPR